MAAYISKEYDVILDVEAGVVGEARADVVTLNIEPLIKCVEELEHLSDELLSSLHPSTEPMFSRPFRGGVYKTAGFLTNMAIGFILGCLFFAAIMFAYIAITNPQLLKAILGG